MAITPSTPSRTASGQLLLSCLFGALLTSACGGGSSLEPAGFELEVEATGVKTLAFNWPEITGATHYKLLKKPNAASGFTQIGADLTETSTTEYISVHLHDWPNALYRVKACDAAGCITSQTIDTQPAMLDSIGYLKSSEPGEMHAFGRALAMSDDGTTLVVGAPGTADNMGTLYFYSRGADGWLLDQTVEGYDLVEFDNFERLGTAVAISGNGNRLAAGGVRQRVHLFTRTQNGWVQDSVLYQGFSWEGQSGFGQDLSFSYDGMTLAIGDFLDSFPGTGVHGNYFDSEENSYRSGAAYVYEYNGSSWVTWTYIKPPVIGREYFFSRLSLSSDGNTLAVGSYREASAATSIDGDMNDTSAPEAGAVFVYARKNHGWAEQAYIKAFNAKADNHFGLSVRLSADGNTLAVGAPKEASDGSDPHNTSASLTGAAYIYTRQGEDWSHQAYLKPLNHGARFGVSLSLTPDGNTLAIGAPADGNPGAGINPTSNEESAADAGAVSLFKRTNNTWTQHSYIKSPNPDAGDLFGISVALSADATTLAVGAPNEQSNASGINGDREDNSLNRAGAAYLY